MRILPLILLLAACSPEAPDKPAEKSLYAGEGRDRLCLSGDRAGFIAYGAGDANCSVRGRVERTDAAMTLLPDGDQDCRIELDEQGATIRVGKAGAACAYYCGPGAVFDGKSFSKNASASPAVDFAGDPLC